MKKIIILVLILSIFCGFNFMITNNVESRTRKEFFNFVKIEETIEIYFNALDKGDKQTLLEVVGGDYFEFTKQGKIDETIKSIKGFGKELVRGEKNFGTLAEEDMLEYKVLVIYEKVHTRNTLWIKEVNNNVKIMGHSIVIFNPRNK